MKKIVAFLLVVAGCFSVFYGSFKKENIQPDLTLVGYIDQADGLGRQIPELAEIFMDEFSINFVSTWENHFSGISKKIIRSLEEKSTEWGKIVIFEDCVVRDKKQKKHIMKDVKKNSICFAYSMWETTRISDEWVNAINKHFDGVLVPADFLVEVYQNSGVKVPIFILPLGRDYSFFENEALKEKTGKTFIFGNLCCSWDRKNQFALVKAFNKAFGNDPDVQLHINARYSVKGLDKVILNEIESLQAENILYTIEKLNNQDYLEKFKSFDCYVSPSKGEGFSIQPREAMILGIPTIVTDNTAQSNICASQLVRAVKSEGTEPSKDPWGDYNGLQFTCEIDDLAEALIDVREHHEEYLNLSEKAREWAMQFDFKNLKPFYRQVISPKKVSLGTVNEITESEMITTSEELYHKYISTFGDGVAS